MLDHVTLVDLFSLRLVSRQISEVIASHTNAIAPAVASNVFPQAKRMLQVAPEQPLDFTWLKSLVPKYLAAVMLDRYILSSHYTGRTRCIPAESDIGDVLREGLVRGIRVWRNLSNISKDIYALPDEIVFRKTSGKNILEFLTSPVTTMAKNVTEHRENLIAERRIEYLQQKTPADLAYFAIAIFLVHSAFRTKHDKVTSCIYASKESMYHGPDDFDWFVKDWQPNPENRILEEGNSWANWAILHEGPWLFYQQWSPENSTSPHLARDKMLSMWREQRPEDAKIRRNAVISLRDEFFKDGFHRPSDHKFDEPLERYAKVDAGELSRCRGKEPLPHIWMDDVPYFINFQDDTQPRRRQHVHSVLERPFD
ncbi:uncharacterized protein N0V89_003340 [Didymosphaeria variabile]|uniref:F-box domain-containing protein n=1 Tax=Didymosphaeria variabile TaxID=1932322 RepID=A0A9W8XTT8_9PLEO|nr:uncharacterized protein N0V89_003340 [Didymosphaeria variabile]KAJ4358756.1 hypothetical protein N0V89_003340 [Didymosphaeria variabile]